MNTLWGRAFSPNILHCSRWQGLFSQEQHMALVMGAPLLGEGESGVGVEVKWEEAQPVLCCCAVLIHTPSCSTLRNSIIFITHLRTHGATWPSMATLWIMKKSRESREFGGEDRGDQDGSLRSLVLWPLLFSLAHYTFYCLGKSELYFWFWCIPSLMTLAGQTDLFKISYDHLRHKG